MFPHQNSPPTDKGVWWWHTESAACQKMGPKVSQWWYICNM